MFIFRLLNRLKPQVNCCKIFIRRTGKSCDSTKTVLLEPCCKTAVITGGTEGIGLAVANQLLCAKARHVVLLSRDTEKGYEAVQSLNCCHGKNKATFIKCDIRCKNTVNETLAKVKVDFQDVRIFVNCAGIWDEADWENQLQTNFVGTVNFNWAIVNTFPQTIGVIVNLSGIVGLQPFPSSPVFSADNSAIIRFSQNFGHVDNMKVSGMRCMVLCTGVTSCTEFLQNVEKKMPCPHMSKGIQDYLKEAHRQKPESVAKAVMELIQFGPSGTVWVIESSRLIYVEVPNWRKYCVLVSQYT